MAHKKAGGSTRNGRDSESKRLGIKLYGGQKVSAGGIIVRHVTPRQIRDQAVEVASAVGSALDKGGARPRLAIRALPAGR